MAVLLRGRPIFFGTGGSFGGMTMPLRGRPLGVLRGSVLIIGEGAAKDVVKRLSGLDCGTQEELDSSVDGVNWALSRQRRFGGGSPSASANVQL